MKNKYFFYSKAPATNDSELLTWKIQHDIEKGCTVIFSDGTKKSFKDRNDARRYINEKFFSMYF